MTEKITMNKASIYLLSITALFVALTYVFTAFVNIRLPIAANGGLIHLGTVHSGYRWTNGICDGLDSRK